MQLLPIYPEDRAEGQKCYSISFSEVLSNGCGRSAASRSLQPLTRHALVLKSRCIQASLFFHSIDSNVSQSQDFFLQVAQRHSALGKAESQCSRTVIIAQRRSMRLSIELLEEVALHLVAQTCPLPPRRPPISFSEESEQDHGVIGDIGQLWRAPAGHPVRTLSQVCRALQAFVRSRMCQVVYIRDDASLRAIELLYRYLRCVDSSALARWTQELTYSGWDSNWDEQGAPSNIVELLFGNSRLPQVEEEADNVLQVTQLVLSSLRRKMVY